MTQMVERTRDKVASQVTVGTVYMCSNRGTMIEFATLPRRERQRRSARERESSWALCHVSCSWESKGDGDT